MQQTEKYQFNLVESGDTFSPIPLNENMEKVEEQFGAMEEALADGLAAATAAVGSGGSTCRISYGSYTANGTPQTLSFDFALAAVFLSVKNGSGYQEGAILLPGLTGSVSSTYTTGLSVSSWGTNSVTFTGGNFSTSGRTVCYVAIGITT